jgi:PmbA protein
VSVTASKAVGDLARTIETALQCAREFGATAAEASVNVSSGLSVTVRLGEVETIEHTRDRGLGMTVYIGQRSGSASTSDLSPAAVRDTARAAATIARFTAEDDCAGLADPERLARDIPDLDLYHPWRPPAEEAIEIARQCEDAARAFDACIRNSEGASATTHEDSSWYGNTHGFLGCISSTRMSVSCAVIAQNARGMQRDDWYSVARARGDLDDPVAVGRRAAERASKRLDSRKVATCTVPVLFEAPAATSLLSHFVGAIRGGNLYRKTSFLLDSLGKQVFAPGIRIHEEPRLLRGLGSAPFDGEGVATQARDLVRDGVLQGYVLDSYSGRKLGMPTTGNAGGVHNLAIDPSAGGLDELIRTLHRGLLVTDLIGFGVNGVTGDYSRGAAGFWVENGTIQYPVEEITIAGNLKDIYKNVVAIGNDVDRRGNIRSGSILIERMTLAGE